MMCRTKKKESGFDMQHLVLVLVLVDKMVCSKGRQKYRSRNLHSFLYLSESS